jgi:hypothetical protein
MDFSDREKRLVTKQNTQVPSCISRDYDDDDDANRQEPFQRSAGDRTCCAACGLPRKTLRFG